MRERSFGVMFAFAGSCVVLSCQMLVNVGDGPPAAAPPGDSGVLDAAIRAAEAGDALALVCPRSKRSCEALRACVDPTNPAFGCGSANCVACSTSNAASVECAGTLTALVCHPTCLPAFDDCDHDPSNGCETSLDKDDSCGACNTKCPASLPLCSKVNGAFTCVSVCPAGLQPCGTQCVDTATNPEHCGGCSKACVPSVNAQPLCTSSNCGSTCTGGTHFCAGACRNDPSHCSEACIDCTAGAPYGMAASCQLDRCEYACAAGFSDCNGGPDDGCETIGPCPPPDNGSQGN